LKAASCDTTDNQFNLYVSVSLSQLDSTQQTRDQLTFYVIEKYKWKTQLNEYRMKTNEEE
jgi:hypothetical protein